MGLMSFFKSADVLGKVTDAVVKGGDALILTDEERIQYNQKAAELHLELTKQIGKESSPTAVSRRIVAMTVLVPFVLLKVGSALIYWWGDIQTSIHWEEVASDFEYPSLAVVAFYFGTHLAGKLTGK
jgi:hypothetical protein